ncbi:MAG: CARDB domain-containing protein [Candidatus Aenigmarchaeota archaeon]|nr:hypothetical protein [Candidatus Aenigmarchaeota archaeon]MDW8160084.1 CARDB domain-containing protein [Candidatus Aenigmarchaeota archaeon]
MVRKNLKHVFMIFLFFLLSSFFSDLAYSLSCTIRLGSCEANERCLFSLYSTINSHVGSCGYYQYNLCCDQIFSYVNQTCNSSTQPILSFFRINNSHVSHPNYYDIKLCAGYSTYPLECEIKTACMEDETCLISMYSTQDSHVAECGYYSNKVCCKQLSDLVLNYSSLELPYKPIFGTNVLINFTIWNEGDVDANGVNVSCYENGILFDSKIINVSKKSLHKTFCNWTVSCNTNISVRADPSNFVKELNETNNEVFSLLEITERLNVSIIVPTNNSNFYRGEIIWLNASVVSSCNNLPPHTTYWYNESSLIGIGDEIQWQIPIYDFILGRKNITAYANSSGYVDSSSTIFVTFLNNPPQIQVSTNVLEVHSGDFIEITCAAYDLEDCQSSHVCNLVGNISILNPNRNWDNSTTNKIGNVFYREYRSPYHPLGEYISYCSVVDTDGGRAENYTKFLVWQNATVFVNLNASYYFFGEGVKIYGSVKRRDNSPLQISPMDIYLDGKKICNTTTDMSGNYACEFLAPNQIGNFKIYLSVTDVLTGKIFTNSTDLVVKFTYGGSEREMEKSPQVSCYEVPQIVVNPDGTLKRVFVKICVWT